MPADLRPVKKAVTLLPKDDSFRILVEGMENEISSILFEEVERRWRIHEQTFIA